MLLRDHDPIRQKMRTGETCAIIRLARINPDVSFTNTNPQYMKLQDYDLINFVQYSHLVRPDFQIMGRNRFIT